MRAPLASVPLLLLAACAAGQRTDGGGGRTAPPRVKVSARDQAAALQRACDDGSASSCYVLALQHRTGRGVKRDPDRAEALLHQACNGGHARSCTTLKRPAPVTVTVKGAAPEGIQPSRFKTIYVGPVVGQQAEIIRAALKAALEESCNCFVVVTDDIDLVGVGELALVGRVVQVVQVARGASPPTGPPPGAPAGALAGALATTAAPVAPPGGTVSVPAEGSSCERVAIAVSFWLFDGAAVHAPRHVMLHTRARAEERCERALRTTATRVAGELVARLDGSHTRRVVLFTDPGVPALEQGNAHAGAGRWKLALEQYEGVIEAAKEQIIAKESLAHALYARSLALSELGRYTEAFKALREAHRTRPDPRYGWQRERLEPVTGEAFAKPPPVRPRRVKAGKKRRKVIQGLRRKVIYK